MKRQNLLKASRTLALAAMMGLAFTGANAHAQTVLAYDINGPGKAFPQDYDWNGKPMNKCSTYPYYTTIGEVRIIAPTDGVVVVRAMGYVDLFTENEYIKVGISQSYYNSMTGSRYDWKPVTPRGFEASLDEVGDPLDFYQDVGYKGRRSFAMQEIFTGLEEGKDYIFALRACRETSSTAGRIGWDTLTAEFMQEAGWW